MTHSLQTSTTNFRKEETIDLVALFGGDESESLKPLQSERERDYRKRERDRRKRDYRKRERDYRKRDYRERDHRKRDYRNSRNYTNDYTRDYRLLIKSSPLSFEDQSFPLTDLSQLPFLSENLNHSELKVNTPFFKASIFVPTTYDLKRSSTRARLLFHKPILIKLPAQSKRPALSDERNVILSILERNFNHPITSSYKVYRARAVLALQGINVYGLHVHHKNRKTLDDRSENLEALTPEQHALEHQNDHLYQWQDEQSFKESFCIPLEHLVRAFLPADFVFHSESHIEYFTTLLYQKYEQSLVNETARRLSNGHTQYNTLLIQSYFSSSDSHAAEQFSVSTG